MKMKLLLSETKVTFSLIKNLKQTGGPDILLPMNKLKKQEELQEDFYKLEEIIYFTKYLIKNLLKIAKSRISIS